MKCPPTPTTEVPLFNKSLHLLTSVSSCGNEFVSFIYLFYSFTHIRCTTCCCWINAVYSKTGVHSKLVKEEEREIHMHNYTFGEG